MASLKEVKNELIQLGLSENQAQVYLVLIQKGELRIQDLVRLAKIPRSSIYDIITSLLGLGLVEKIVDEKFNKIKAYPILSIRHGLNEKLMELQAQLSRLEHLDKDIDQLPKNGLPTSTAVRYYQGVSGARQLLWNTLKTTQPIYVYSAWGRGSYVGIKFYKSFVAESRQRQIKEQVLINPSERVFESIRKYADTSIGRTSPKNIRAVDSENILIKGETFIYDNVYAQLYLKEEEIGGFEIESQNFTQMQKSIFETLWNAAKPVSELL